MRASARQASRKAGEGCRAEAQSAKAGFGRSTSRRVAAVRPHRENTNKFGEEARRVSGAPLASSFKRSFTIEYPANGSFFRPQSLLRPQGPQQQHTRSVQGTIASRSWQLAVRGSVLSSGGQRRGNGGKR
jgi:hypothetical protein